MSFLNKKSLQWNSSSFRRVFLVSIITILNSFFLYQCAPKESINEDKIDLAIPEAVTGEQYTYEFNIQELDSNYYLINSGDDLPRGLSLDPAQRVIHGIPEESGTFYLTITVIDTISNYESAPSLIKLKVKLPEGISTPHQFYISTNSPLPIAYSGENYNVRFSARNNIGDIKWKCAPLPSGLNFNAESGTIKGTPISEGLFCINVFAQDTQDNTRKDFKTFALQILNPKSRDIHSSTDPNSPRKLDEVLARLECGHILFTAPSYMKQFEERKVSLLISLDNLESDLKSKIIVDTDIHEAISELEEQNYDVNKIDESVNNIKDEIMSSEESDPEYFEEQISEIEEEVKKLRDNNASTERLESAIGELKKLTITGRLISEEVRLTSIMSANLEGSGFEIKNLNDENQAVGARTITEWNWIIKAIKSKKQEITLTLYAQVQLDNALSSHKIKVFEQDIEVKVSIPRYVFNFYKKHWEFFWGALLIPIGIWFLKKIRKQKTQS